MESGLLPDWLSSITPWPSLKKKSGVAGVQELQNETQPNSPATGTSFPPDPDPINAFLAAQCIKLLAHH